MSHDQHKRPLPENNNNNNTVNVICIDLSDDDEQDNENVAINTSAFTGSRKKVKSEPESPKKGTTSTTTATASPEVEIVAPVAPVLVPASATRKGPSSSLNSDNDNDDVLVLGATNVQKLPHLRQDCPDFAFDKTLPQWEDVFFYKPDTIAANEQCCNLCYCYACDAPANQCNKWKDAVKLGISSHNLWLDNHCCANDKFNGWMQQRKNAIQMRQEQEKEQRKARNSFFAPPAGRAHATTAPATTTTTSRDTKAPASSSSSSSLHPLLESGEYHLREYCWCNKFQVGQISEQGKLQFKDIAENMIYCPKCFCFVCDKPAKKCRKWRISSKKGIVENHCCATYTEPLWIQQYRYCHPHKPTLDPQQMAALANVATGDGPFAPNHEIAPRDVSLTKCRKCGWYSRFAHANFQRPPHPTGCLDWCQKCGRIASEKDFGKVEAAEFVTGHRTDLFFLGEKIIPFRLKPHDPRQMDDYMQSWLDHEQEWTYDEAEMQEDLFRHRFGERPTLKMIMASIPVLEHVPHNASVKKTSNQYSRYTSYSGGTELSKHSAWEIEALLLEQHNHKALLQILDDLGTIAINKNELDEHRSIFRALVEGDIKAQFDKETRSGSFTIRLYLPGRAFDPKMACSNLRYSNLLGNWFDIFPFRLSEISGPIRAKEGFKECINSPCSSCVYKAQAQKLAKNAVACHNVETEKFLEKLSFVSSSGSEIIGGISLNDASLEGCLRRFCSENFAQTAFPVFAAPLSRQFCHANGKLTGDIKDGICLDKYWIERQAGVVSHHRAIHNQSTIAVPWGLSERDGVGSELKQLEQFLTHEDAVLAVSNLQSDILNIIKRTSSGLNGMLEHLENLGHESVAFVDGLNIELLQFQRQALHWALERERCPDGIQSFWWAKLPKKNNLDRDLYFNPVLQTFTRHKPLRIRGGFIASEMGLGKTVISLGLILCNPAPPSPPSGSHVTEISKEKDTEVGNTDQDNGWDKDLYSQTSADCPRRGSILSRGTLVVCPVSLVGQWIEEAKSKLKDPGMVYPYHGQNRTRDPNTLSKAAIVVTTYQVLASDATYHAKKAGDEYVPPVEQVRWWRIICDEGHSLQASNTHRSAALLRLVSDNKWLVSGTPVNTSFSDLSNQLKFLGIDCEQMMNVFKQSAFVHTGDSKQEARSIHTGHQPVFGNLPFFLRTIMLRHTQKQKYRGTATTLMSLPPKTERVLEIDFTFEERQHYDTLEDAARSFYLNFKAQNQGQLSRHHFLLTQKLTQTRTACSGGRYTMDAVTEEGEEFEEQPDEAEDQKKPKKKKETVNSDFIFRSKLNTLIRELGRIRFEDPSSKCLVFSRYNSTLMWLQEELPRHGFQYRTLSGSMSMKQRAKALHEFQSDPPTTIFLLSMGAGACGINLTQANYVFLMEPSFNTALEAQAIGRVHRLGQKRSTQVTRLIMKDSIETRLIKVRECRTTNDQTLGDDDDDKKSAAAEVLLGSVKSDRATVVAEEEFDCLFGISTTPGSPIPTDCHSAIV